MKRHLQLWPVDECSKSVFCLVNKSFLRRMNINFSVIVCAYLPFLSLSFFLVSLQTHAQITSTARLIILLIDVRSSSFSLSRSPVLSLSVDASPRVAVLLLLFIVVITKKVALKQTVFLRFCLATRKRSILLANGINTGKTVHFNHYTYIFID